MKDLEYSVSNQENTKCLLSYLETTSCSDLDSLRFIIRTKHGTKTDYKEQTEECAHYYSTNSSSLKRQKLIIKESTSLNIKISTDRLSKTMDYKVASSHSTPEIIDKYFGSNYSVDVISTRHSYCQNHFFNNTNQMKCEVYRCEFSTNEVNYCPACTSDAMFEVLKSLYECYKRRVCDNCNCILCGHVFREKRRTSQFKKSKTLVKIDSRIKTVQERIKQTEDAMVGKTPAEKEKLLKNLAMTGAPLPEGKTASEKSLINKVGRNLGIPPAPKTEPEKEKFKKVAELGLLQPLEGKDLFQKEKILQNLTDMNIPLPEGRTDSEKALIKKVQAAASVPPDSLSEKLRKAKDAGFLTPLASKSPQQKKKILTGLAIAGLPLPEAKSPSEQKLIKEVRSELGLPPEPKTEAMKKKYAKAAEVGLMQPLEGKSPQEKKRILTRLADMGIPLPTGRSPSEKSLIAKVKAEPRPYSILAPSQKMRKAKAAGLITSLDSKTPEQREKILNGLANLGIPLPEGTTVSEKNLINKVRNNLGLPPEPQTPAMKDNHKKAADAGLLTPLEGKTPREKERILRGLQDMGIPLPQGRTPSEKALISKIKSEPRFFSMLSPSEKMRRAKVAGLITPLKGKTSEEKEKKLSGLSSLGIPLPEGKTSSEKKLIDKVRTDLGLPPTPKTSAMKDKHIKAANAGLLQPLEGKTPKEKEKILRGLNDIGIPLPEGRTPSEKALIDKITGAPSTHSVPPLSDKIRMAKNAGFLTPLDGKTTEQKQKKLSGLASLGIPLPEGKTSSEKKLIDKVRTDLGLPPTPKTPAMKDKHIKAANAGLLQPLEGKTPKEKEKILRGLNDIGIPLPEGRTPSEKALIDKITGAPSTHSVPPLSDKIRMAKNAGFLTPLDGKTTEQKQKKLSGLASLGIPLPEGKTSSEKKLIDKVRTDLGLPPTPKTPAMKDKHIKAANAGLLQPLEGKTPKEKEKILRGLNDIGIPLPEGRTPSEKALIDKITGAPSTHSVPPLSDKIRMAKNAGFLTPLDGKTTEQKQKKLSGLASLGIPLPEGKTSSEKKLIDKVRTDLGLPPTPKTPAMKDKHIKAANAGLLQPLEGKTPKEKEKILRGLNDIGIPLPEGRTPSEKALIDKITGAPSTHSVPPLSDKIRMAKNAGFLTPLDGKTTEQKQKKLSGLASLGIPLPEGKTSSEKKLIDKVRTDLGLPPTPKTPAMKDKHIKAANAGLLQPLEGKTPKEKEKILRGLNDIGIPLPEGRTPSEKALIDKITGAPSTHSVPPLSDKIRMAKNAGFLTPLDGKTTEQKQKKMSGLASLGIPLPEGKTSSEKKLIDKVRTDLGLPPTPKTPAMKDKHIKAANAGLLQPLEGKTPKEKEKILRGLNDIGIPLPEGRTPSEKALIDKITGAPSTHSVPPLSDKIRMAKNAGFLTPLDGKTTEQKQKKLSGLASLGIPLPEGKTSSEKKLIDKVRTDLGLPPTPKTPAMKDKHIKAANAGLLQPLEGKTPKEKEKILRGLNDIGIPLPEGRTPSEKALIDKITGAPSTHSVPPLSDKIRMAKNAGFLTPLDGKTTEQKQKKLSGLASLGIPLPEGKTSSEKKLIDKVRTDLGLPPTPKTPAMKDKHIKAANAGLLQPLEGKTPKEKEKILRGLNDIGIPLPEGRTPSEKALIDKITGAPPTHSVPLLSDKMRMAKKADFISPLDSKTTEQKQKKLSGLASLGIPLPEGKTSSEKKLIDKVRTDLGLPPTPKTPDMKDKHAKAAEAGILKPLEGKSPSEKEKILRGLIDMGIPLPEGRTPSERTLITKIKPICSSHKPFILSPSEKMRRAKVAGLITPLKNKTPQHREKILKGLANLGIPLPEGTTDSENNLLNKVRANLGLPPEPTTPSMKDKHTKAAEVGVLQPLQGKTPQEKEKNLRGLNDMGIPLPEGRTPSEKALISKIKSEFHAPSILSPSEKIRRAKVAGLITPLQGKTPEQREKILKGLATLGIPLPEGTTDSEKNLINKVRANLGLPPEPTTPSMKDKHTKAAEVGLLQPLQSKTPKEKEKILRGLSNMGIPLPEGRTPSEKALISKVKSEFHTPSTLSPSEKMRRAKVAGLITPLKNKTPEQKENILKGLATLGIALPQGTTDSENNLINKIRSNLGLPPEPTTPSMKDKHTKAAEAGLLQPLQGKMPQEKERILRGLKNMGIPLPEGRTPSEKALINKVKAESHIPSILTPSEKMRSAKVAEPENEVTRDKHAKAADATLLQPLEGKTPKEKEKTRAPSILSEKIHGAKAGTHLIPFKKTIVDKIPPDALLTPLENKTLEQKEKILRGRAATGLPLPIGKTPSEKKLIDKIKADSILTSLSDVRKKVKAAGVTSSLKDKTPTKKTKILKDMIGDVPIPETSSDKELAKIVSLPKKTKSEKIRDAKAAGLLTPLAGKSAEQKEKIIRGLVNTGLPLPEAKTPSEIKLIERIRAETGLPHESKTPSMKEKYKKAQADGLISPFEGKLPEEKKAKLKKLHDAGLPLPEGKTPSEKTMAKKVKASLKTIVKTSVCDHACGCDKKKIKFKHSYVRITVISPDLSSICDCPNECLPTTSSRLIDPQDGIKVTIGNVTQVPATFSTEGTNSVPNLVTNVNHEKIQLISDCKSLSLDSFKVAHDHMRKKDKLGNEVNSVVELAKSPNKNYLNNYQNTSSIHISNTNLTRKKSTYPYLFERYFERYLDYPKCFVSNSGILKTQACYSNGILSTQTSDSNLTTILIVKSDTSLSMSTSTGTFYTDSLLSYTDDTNSVLTRHSDKECYYSDTTLEYSVSVTDDYTTEDAIESCSTPYIPKLTSINRVEEEYSKYKKMTLPNYICYRMSQTKQNLKPMRQKNEVTHSAIWIKKVHNDTDIATVLNEPVMI